MRQLQISSQEINKNIDNKYFSVLLFQKQLLAYRNSNCIPNNVKLKPPRSFPENTGKKTGSCQDL